MKKIEHIGIAVRDIGVSKKIFEDVLGTAPYKEEVVETERVITSFFKVGESKIELVQATDADSPVAKFLDKNREGIHHIAFEVDDIFSEIARLKLLGYRMINEEPRPGADGKLVAFLHPKSSNGVLVELCMES